MIVKQSNKFLNDEEILKRFRRSQRWPRFLSNILEPIFRIFLPKTNNNKLLFPNRILLSHYGHLGDIINSTLIIPILKCAFPNIEIGFLIGSWSKKVVENHPDVNFIHILDHWKFNRNQDSQISKLIKYIQTRKKVINDLKCKSYDLAIDLNGWGCNSALELWSAKIPTRIGYSPVSYFCSGFGAFFTHPQPVTYNKRKHEFFFHLDLLRVLNISDHCFRKQTATLWSHSKAGVLELCNVLGVESQENYNYFVIHAGSGVSFKEWPIEKWREIVAHLAEKGEKVLLTGLGRDDKLRNKKIAEGFSNCFNACDRLSWNGFVEAIHAAKIVYSVETSAGYIAAALGTPCVWIHTGTIDAVRWTPLSQNCMPVTNLVPCSPCFKKNGCAEMNCIRDITVEEVFSLGEKLVGDSR